MGTHLTRSMSPEEAYGALANIAIGASLELEADFVPWSRSERRKSDPTWRCMTWNVRLVQTAPYRRTVVETIYSKGVGHITYSKAVPPRTKMQQELESLAIESPRWIERDQLYMVTTGFQERATFAKPTLVDVLGSCLSDADVMNYSGFGDWANALGYDTDSIKARDTFLACVDIALRARAALGEDFDAALKISAYL